jgi:hypothetical protein
MEPIFDRKNSTFTDSNCSLLPGLPTFSKRLRNRRSHTGASSVINLIEPACLFCSIPPKDRALFSAPKSHRSSTSTITPNSEFGLKPPDLLPVYTDGGAGIVPIISPGRVMKMDDEIAVVRDYPIAETDLADGLPVSNGLSLALRKENKS